MAKYLILLLSCCAFSVCSSNSECDARAITIADKYEGPLFTDKAKDRQGFFHLGQKLQSELGSDLEAYSLLANKPLFAARRQKVLEEFGPILLMMAISKADGDKVAFYLQSGVESLSYQSHVGVPILDLLEIKDRKVFQVFKTFFEKNEISSEAFDEVEHFYDECI
ncbi:hypothetical protein [Aliiglaciecola litoralis]|uniref:Uncharacterized protein n=1 Tax=Aliiglaciecola litoralis TaxID=582857 RepID=A0ABN1LIZ7_9ALTE